MRTLAKVISYCIVTLKRIVAAFSVHKKNEQERNTVLYDFSKVIAHEIRTPLSTTLLLCKSVICEAAKEKPNTKKIISNVKKISRESQEVLMYIDTVLFKLNDSPQSFPNFEKFDAGEYISSILEQYFSEEERKIVSSENVGSFIIEGNKHFVMYIIFNVLQNLICQIKSSGKGEIIIMLSE
ncbi:MAG: hypothetical protein LBJ96_05500, partial [Holosporaceae bacterium]|nr:hypothetical protein [Holosporaceae bacterium]